MPNLTPNIGLKKPLDNEAGDIAVINENMDKIDQAVEDLKRSSVKIEFDAHLADYTRVPYWGGLTGGTGDDFKIDHGAPDKLLVGSCIVVKADRDAIGYMRFFWGKHYGLVSSSDHMAFKFKKDGIYTLRWDSGTWVVQGDNGGINFDGRQETITVNVGPSRDFKTIRSAIDSLAKVNAGDRQIILDAGTYNELIIISGFHGGTLTIKSASGVSAILSGNLFNIGNNTCKVSINSIEFRIINNISLTSGQFTLYGCMFTGAGVFLSECTAHLENCTVNNSTNIAISANGGSVVSVFNLKGSGNKIGYRSDHSIILRASNALTATTLDEKAQGGQIFF
ncbi:hypothetical protein E0485_23010 [Paenibacillus albiflavus]|uniref:DUF1565 domain-containing protein n=1 Tax=Paenibacillus albiflavus TaxID=2545760 RepID=A0A4R4E084_9BACL|nr:hypothetical protein [Paenibacillus albiflavus]TCZ70960.1 hypothetical protein E0485_23010 [Paenibacillus albiflavus]